MKKCNKCEKTQDLSCFSKHSGNADGLSYQCKKCHNLYRYNRLRNDPIYRAKIRKDERLRKFKISQEEYDNLYKEQNSKCAICNKKESTTRALAIDHSHKTQKIRGLLCGNCNTGLGLFKDSVSKLKQAIKYLERTK